MMLKEFHNECRISLKIVPVGPILVKAKKGLGAAVDMAFVRTLRGGQPAAYLPGSALKGIIRSHAERIGRTLQPKKICDPFNNTSRGVTSCSQKLKKVKNQRKRLPAEEAYRGSCPACRLFGSLGFGGRLNIDDAYIVSGQEPVFEYRDGVGIDRFSGGTASSAKFQFEVVTGGAFQTVITIRNFALWQLSWITLVLRDMQDGLVPIGSGTSRGLGKVKTSIQSMEFHVMARRAPHSLAGISHSYESEGKEDYGFADEEPLILPEGVTFRTRGLRHHLCLQGEQQEVVWDDLSHRFTAFLDGFHHMEDWRSAQPKRMKGGRR